MKDILKLFSRLVVLSIIIPMLYIGSASAVEILQLTSWQANALIKENSDNAQFIILDVRTPKEYAQGHIAGAAILDYYNPAFKKGLARLDQSKTYFIYCRSGNRSGRTLKLMTNMGFGKIYHLTRGIIDWNKSRLPLVKSSS